MSNATKVASEPGVGTRKLFENDKVIVWDFVLPVGAETPVHTHDHSYMWFAVQGAPLQIYDEHGNDVGLFPVPTKGVFELKVQDGTIEVMSEIGKGTKVPARHKAKNGAEDLKKVIHYAQLALELQYGIKPADELADMVRAGKGAQA